MKKLALFLILIIPVSGYAVNNLPGSSAPGGNGSLIPASPYLEDSLLGCNRFNIDLSTTPVLVFSGPGFIEKICSVAAGTLNTGPSFAVAEDSASISGMGIAGNGTNSATLVAGKTVLASPAAVQEGASTAITGSNSGCGSAETAPIQFVNGLVVAASTNTINVYGCYRPNTGSANGSYW